MISNYCLASNHIDSVSVYQVLKWWPGSEAYYIYVFAIDLNYVFDEIKLIYIYIYLFIVIGKLNELWNKILIISTTSSE